MSPLVIFNATDRPLKVSYGQEVSLLPSRGFVTMMAYGMPDVEDERGRTADLDLTSMPGGQVAIENGLRSVMIDEKTPFAKSRP